MEAMKRKLEALKMWNIYDGEGGKGNGGRGGGTEIGEEGEGQDR